MQQADWNTRHATGRVALGLRLRALRAEAGMTLSEVAAGSGLSLSYLSDIERGRKTPALDGLDRMCFAMGASVASALAGVYPFGAADAPRDVSPPPDGRSSKRSTA